MELFCFFWPWLKNRDVISFKPRLQIHDRPPNKLEVWAAAEKRSWEEESQRAAEKRREQYPSLTKLHHFCKMCRLVFQIPQFIAAGGGCKEKLERKGGIKGGNQRKKRGEKAGDWSEALLSICIVAAQQQSRDTAWFNQWIHYCDTWRPYIRARRREFPAAPLPALSLYILAEETERSWKRQMFRDFQVKKW